MFFQYHQGEQNIYSIDKAEDLEHDQEFLARYRVWTRYT